jgi:hypothetical protein
MVILRQKSKRNPRCVTINSIIFTSSLTYSGYTREGRPGVLPSITSLKRLTTMLMVRVKMGLHTSSAGSGPGRLSRLPRLQNTTPTASRTISRGNSPPIGTSIRSCKLVMILQHLQSLTSPKASSSSMPTLPKHTSIGYRRFKVISKRCY